VLADLQKEHPCMYNPENVAMLQALQSRSHKSILDLIGHVEYKGNDSFINQYVIKYGHDSIADCGHTVVFFEGVSILCAMALQDFPLYAGIESSTRYMNFQNKGIVVPSEFLDNPELFNLDTVEALHENCLSIYNSMTDDLMEEYTQAFPESSQQAIKNKVFDITRGFLPAGIKTNVSLAGSLGKIKDWLVELTFYPLQEVREATTNALDQLKASYPATYSDIEARKANISEYIKAVNYMRFVSRDTATRLSVEYTANSEYDYHIFSGMTHTFNPSDQWAISDPKRRKLQYAQNICRFGTLFDFAFMLDIGSFRDLHRHRRGYCPLPILTNQYDFSPVYHKMMLCKHLVNKSQILVKCYYDHLDWAFVQFSDKLVDREADANFDLRMVKQYFIMLGSRVPCSYICDLSQIAYIIELRSAETVHFSLRSLVSCFYKYVRDSLGESVAKRIFYTESCDTLDSGLDNPSENRANQTIFTEKGQRLEDL
jgi:thymidylate synthase ThyX